MRSRGLVVAIAVVLAILAAVGVIVYTNQVRTEVTEQDTVPVLVSNQDIPANTNLDPLIAQGTFTFVRVPEEAVVEGVVTSQEELVGATTIAPIFAREQITTSRLSTSDKPVSIAGVTPGHIGISMDLESARGGGGNVQRGDSVAVYATFEAGTPVTVQDLKKILSPQAIQRLFGAAATTSGQAGAFVIPFRVTTTLVPTVGVLGIQNPEVNEEGRSSGGEIQLTLDLLPEDARDVVFANEVAQIWIGLLNPEDKEEGFPIEGQIGVDHDRLVGVVQP
jgi:Flp pilus assembly protein CpaB